MKKKLSKNDVLELMFITNSNSSNRELTNKLREVYDELVLTREDYAQLTVGEVEIESTIDAGFSSFLYPPTPLIATGEKKSKSQRTLEQICKTIEGWDFEQHGVLNMKNLATALSMHPATIYNYKSKIEQLMNKKNQNNQEVQRIRAEVQLIRLKNLNQKFGKIKFNELHSTNH